VAYVEGFVIYAAVPVPIAHAWLTPTTGARAFADAYEVTIRPEQGEVLVYWGVALRGTYLAERTLVRGAYAPLIDDWRAGWPLLREPETRLDALYPVDRIPNYRARVHDTLAPDRAIE